MSWVFESSRSKKGARLVLLAIADCANDEGRQAYPSMPKLQQKTGLGERAITGLVADLEKLGELIVQRNAGPRGCNLYTVVMTPAESAPPQILHPRRKRQSPPQKTTVDPADSAPGTIREPSENHPLKDSGQLSLDGFEEPPPKDSTTKKVRAKADPELDPEFMKFWHRHPHPVAQPETYRFWKQTVSSGKRTAEQLLADAGALAEHHEREQTPFKFIPQSKTWLRDKRWADRLPDPQIRAAGQTSSKHQGYQNPDDPSKYEEGF